MKVNTKSPILALSGAPIVENGNPVTLGSVLGSLLDRTPAKTLEEKVAAYQLAKKLTATSEVELNPTEVELCRNLVTLLASNVIAGQVLELLPLPALELVKE